MKCYRYIVEGYNDWMHKQDYFKGHKIYVPEPYNFCIFTLNDEIKYMQRQYKIDKFTNDQFGFNPVIQEIELDEKIVKKFYDNFLKEEEIKKEREILVTSLFQFKTDEDKAESLFEEANILHNEKKYHEAIQNYEFCIKVKFSSKESYYNIACCYSLMKNKEESIKYIKLALDHGYTNWFHMVSDEDLKYIIDDFDIVEIIKKLIILHPKKVFSYKTNYKNGKDEGDNYLEKHNLTQYYKNSLTNTVPNFLNY
jgi:tetratricopeptide (TPR) repeat protein